MTLKYPGLVPTLGLAITLALLAGPQPASAHQHPSKPTPSPSSTTDDMDMMDMPGMEMHHASPKPSAMSTPRLAIPAPSPMASSSMNHGMNMHPMEGMESPAPASSASGEHGGMEHSMHAMDPLMLHQQAQGSGTSVAPTAAKMYMWSFRTGDWFWMAHGSAVGGFNHQDGPLGTNTWTAPNWAMLMGSRYLGPGTLDLRLMGSLEPLTLPPGGEPELFQTGETYLGQPLVNKQHPHDLFMELAALYSWKLDDANSVFFYGAPAGEPALGPTAFMHRASAEDNHWAPLAHHLEDSTHISYGVGTVGYHHAPFQIEGSIFNGREPDENRWNFDFGPLDSYAARLTYFPDPHWVAQVSSGHLVSPEALEPGQDVNRTTASITNVQNWAGNTLSTSLIWGQNVEHGGALALQGYTAESQLDLGRQNHLYGRFELLDKDLSTVPGLQTAGIQRVGALTLGGVRDFLDNDKVAIGLGADATVYSKDAEVSNVYGFNPVSFQVYLRLRPPVMDHTMGHAMADHDMPMDAP